MLARHVAGYLPATIASAGFGFLSLIIYTRLLTPEQFGRYALVLATVELLHALFFEGLALAYQRFYPAEAIRQRLGALSATAFNSLLVLAIFITLVFTLALSVIPLDADLLLALWIALPIVIFRALVRFLLAGYRAAMQVGRYGATDVSQNGLGLGFGIILVLAGFDEYGALVGLALGAGTVVFVHIVKRSIPFVPGKWDRLLSQELLQYAVPMAGVFAAGFAVSTSDRFIVEYFLGTESVGQYAAIYVLVSRSLDFAFAIVQPPMSALIFAAIAREGPASARRQLEENGSVLLLVGVPATLGLSIISHTLTQVMVGAEYATAAALAPVIAAATFASRFKAYFFDEGFHLAQRTDLQFWSLVPAAIIKIGLSLLLTPRYGLTGTVVALVIGEVTALIGGAALVQRIFAIRIQLRQAARITIAGVAMTGAIYIFQFTNDIAGLFLMVITGASAFFLVSLALNTLNMRSRLRMIVCRSKDGKK